MNLGDLPVERQHDSMTASALEKQIKRSHLKDKESRRIICTYVGIASLVSLKFLCINYLV